MPQQPFAGGGVAGVRVRAPEIVQHGVPDFASFGVERDGLHTASEFLIGHGAANTS
jgi:hypothetical protein